jgi:hypothetical protein
VPWEGLAGTVAARELGRSFKLWVYIHMAASGKGKGERELKSVAHLASGCVNYIEGDFDGGGGNKRRGSMEGDEIGACCG